MCVCVRERERERERETEIIYRIRGKTTKGKPISDSFKKIYGMKISWCEKYIV